MEEQDHNHGARKLTVAISFYDLGQRKPSPEELVEMAKRFNYEAGAVPKKFVLSRPLEL